MAVSLLQATEPQAQGFSNSSTMAMDTVEMDVDMDIDLGPIDIPEETGEISVPTQLDSNEVAAVEETGDLESNATPQKVYIRGVDDLTTDDLKAFAAQHHPAEVPLRFEWIDDTSANLVYDTPATAMRALESFSLPRGAAPISLLQMRPAKSLSNRPDSRLEIRIATNVDVKRRRAHEASRFYMMHPEHDPRERARRQHHVSGSRDYRKRRFDDDEHRRRRRENGDRSHKVSMYDDFAPVEAASRRNSMSIDSNASNGRINRRTQSKHGQRGDYYRPRTRFEHAPLRDRSASPETDDKLNSNRRLTRQRSGPSNSLARELFPTRSPTGTKPHLGKELFPNKSVAASLKKELFPTKTSNPHHRRSDAIDAADEAADLFATGMAFSEMKAAMGTMVPAMDASFGRLWSSEPEPQYDPGATLEDAGMSIRGASQHQDSGISIVGAAKKSHIGTIRELFPSKTGNSGKELFVEKLQGRGLKRNKAEDMFY
ncbi:MAG: hypothetical protein Q9201_002169 [Fulgogasparrea decipioides]